MDALRIAIAIVVAGALIALAVYARPIPDRYAFKIAEGEVQLIDTATGDLLFCEMGECDRYDRDGNIARVGRDRRPERAREAAMPPEAQGTTNQQ